MFVAILVVLGLIVLGSFLVDRLRRRRLIERANAGTYRIEDLPDVSPGLTDPGGAASIYRTDLGGDSGIAN